MPFDARTLIYFTRAVRSAGISKAAEALKVEASTVSRAITTLEYELAADLLIRRPEGATPSFEGKQLLDAADLVLDWMHRLLIARSHGQTEVPSPSALAAPLSLDASRALLGAPISLRTLSHFSTVLEEGSYSRAARRLHLTQPTLGRRIAALEGWLGVALFERDRAGSAPTPFARALYTASLEVQRLSARVMRRADVGFLHEARDVRLGSVMPAGADSSLAILLAQVIKKSGGRDWRRSVAVTTSSAAELMERALGGALDAAIVDVADIPDAFARIELARRPLHVIVATASCKPGDDASDTLARLPIGLPSRGTGLRNATDHLLASARLPSRQIIECGSIPVLLRLVIEGVCCAILPRAALSREEARVRAFPLPGSALITSLIWTHAKESSPQVRLIRDLVGAEPFI
jgi:LysR family transcriptional regulator, nitrogen assimilation regulatory protein